MSPSKKTRSRRLRKKLYVGEFQEYGFRFEADLAAELSTDQQDDLICRLLDEAIEPQNLALGGWVTEGYVARYGRGSVTEQERQAVEAWLKQQPEYASVRVAPLEDAWYPS